MRVNKTTKHPRALRARKCAISGDRQVGTSNSEERIRTNQGGKSVRILSQNRKFREGSIPMILIVVSILGIFAVSSLFMTSGTARQEKRTELNEKARIAAEAAIEEVLVKMSNSKASPGALKKDGTYTYTTVKPAAVTYMLEKATDPVTQERLYPGGSLPDGVKVMTRLIEKPENAQAKARFESLLDAVPGFARTAKDNPAGATVASALGTQEFARVQADYPADPEGELSTYKAETYPYDPTTLLGLPPVPAGVSATKEDYYSHNPDWMTDAPWNTANPTINAAIQKVTGDTGDRSGLNYYDTYHKEYASADLLADAGFNGNNDNKYGASMFAAFNALPILPAKEWWTEASQAPIAQGAPPATDPTNPDANPQDVVREATIAGAVESNTNHSEVQLTKFQEKWDAAMDVVAQHVLHRVEGCDGDINYGVGAEMAAFALGHTADGNQDEEEFYVEEATQAGYTDYRAAMISLDATAEVGTPLVSASQTVSAHRIMQTTSFAKVREQTRDQLAPYLMRFYNLTPDDLQMLGFANVSASGGKVDKVLGNSGILGSLKDKFGEGSARFFPFTLATCLGDAKE